MEKKRFAGIGIVILIIAGVNIAVNFPEIVDAAGMSGIAFAPLVIFALFALCAVPVVLFLNGKSKKKADDEKPVHHEGDCYGQFSNGGTYSQTNPQQNIPPYPHNFPYNNPGAHTQPRNNTPGTQNYPPQVTVPIKRFRDEDEEPRTLFRKYKICPRCGAEEKRTAFRCEECGTRL